MDRCIQINNIQYKMNTIVQPNLEGASIDEKKRIAAEALIQLIRKLPINTKEFESNIPVLYRILQ